MASSSEDIDVLCVDDDDALRSLVVDMLEDIDSLLAVDDLGDPTRVLDRLRTGPEYDCVVCDFEMPRRSGLEVLDAIREPFPDLPFILYTGKGSEEIASEAISAGVTDYLQKQSGAEHYEILANRIRKYAERYRADRERALTQERYECLVEQSVVGIGLSQDGVFEYVNPKFAELFDYTPGELIGEPVFTFIDESDHDRVRRAIQQREDERVERVHYVVTAKSKHGDRFDIEVSGSQVVYDGDPAVLGVVQPVGIGRRSAVGLPGVSATDLAATLRSALASLSGDRSADAGIESVRDTLDSAVDTLESAAGATPNDRVDLAARCRRAWADCGPPDADLTVAQLPAVLARKRAVESLFTQLFAQWADFDRPLSVTLDGKTGGFELTIEPQDDRGGVDFPPDPPALGRTAERLGWDVLIASTRCGGVRYVFREVTFAD